MKRTYAQVSIALLIVGLLSSCVIDRSSHPAFKPFMGKTIPLKRAAYLYGPTGNSQLVMQTEKSFGMYYDQAQGKYVEGVIEPKITLNKGAMVTIEQVVSSSSGDKDSAVVFALGKYQYRDRWKEFRYAWAYLQAPDPAKSIEESKKAGMDVRESRYYGEKYRAPWEDDSVPEIVTPFKEK